MGLWSIDLPVVAHVSIFLGADIKGKFKKWILKENLYLQITSPPPDTKSVYTYETGSLYLHEKYGSGNKSSSWKKFFVERLRGIKEVARMESAEASSKAIKAYDKYAFLSRVIPDEIILKKSKK